MTPLSSLGPDTLGRHETTTAVLATGHGHQAPHRRAQRHSSGRVRGIKSEIDAAYPAHQVHLGEDTNHHRCGRLGHGHQASHRGAFYRLWGEISATRQGTETQRELTDSSVLPRWRQV